MNINGKFEMNKQSNKWFAEYRGSFGYHPINRAGNIVMAVDALFLIFASISAVAPYSLGFTFWISCFTVFAIANVLIFVFKTQH